MGTLIYATTVSVDGYVADADGDFAWTGPSDEVFQVHLDRITEVSTEVLGRRTYGLMEYWETYPDDEGRPAAEREFARQWRRIDKVVASSTMTPDDLVSDRARLVPELDLPELRRVVEEAAGLVEIFGPTVAAPAFRAGLVEEVRFFVAPKVVGGGLRALPDDVRLDLRLVEQRSLGEIVYLRYATG